MKKYFILLISLFTFSNYCHAYQLANGGFEDGFNNWNVSFIDNGLQSGQKPKWYCLIEKYKLI